MDDKHDLAVSYLRWLGFPADDLDGLSLTGLMDLIELDLLLERAA